MSATRRRSSQQAMALGAGATVVSVLPTFLVSALAAQVTKELAFGAVGLGAAVALSRVSAAATAPYLGQLSDRLGATRSIRIVGLLAASASVGIATTATTWSTLVVWLMIAGATNGLGQPAANRLLSVLVPPGRLGTAFGLKQSSQPAAALLAGASVPLIGTTLGWRWAFGLAALASLAIAVASSPPPHARYGRVTHSPTPPLAGRRRLRLLTISFALSTMSSSAATIFYVDAAVQQGSSPSFAGTMLAVASGTSIAVRVSAGIISDRIETGHLRICATLLIVGAVGLALLAINSPQAMAIGIVITLGGTWGFNGVFWYSLVRAHPEAPGRVTGAVFPGGLIGGTLGPFGFGLIADHIDYTTAWQLTSALAILAAIFMLTNASGPPQHVSAK